MTENVILVVIDCLRADHVGAYGYGRPTTPRLDRWADQGVLWERAHSTSSWTRPSVTSLLTGLYPTQHGVQRGVKRRDSQQPATTFSYRAAHLTLAERFQRRGWRCAAFCHNEQLAPFSGLQRGFDVYRWDLRGADAILAALGEWLSSEPQRPAFAYLHFSEAHWPYKPRRRHVALFGGDRDQNPLYERTGRDLGHLRLALRRGETTLSEGEIKQLTQLYDGAIRRLDGKLAALEHLLDEFGCAERTALVVTADHGDEFLDHGAIGHGHTLYEELTHVPLVLRSSDGRRGLRIPQPVSLVDLADTLVRLAGLEDEAGRRDLLQPGAATGAVVSELQLGRRYVQTLHDGDIKLHRRYRFEIDPATCKLSPARLRRSAPFAVSDRLYDLASDPGEKNDLAVGADHAQHKARMGEALDRWWQEASVLESEPADSEVAVDEVVVQRLRDLGYLE